MASNSKKRNNNLPPTIIGSNASQRSDGKWNIWQKRIVKGHSETPFNHVWTIVSVQKNQPSWWKPA